MSVKVIIAKPDNSRAIFEFDLLPRKGEQMMLPAAFGFDVYEVTWVQHWPIHDLVADENRIVLFVKYITNWDGDE